MEKINLVIGVSNIACGVIVGGLSIPMIKEKVKMNNFYGVRFAKSFESDENWYKINKKGGILMFRWSIIVLLLGLTCFVQPRIEGVIMWVHLMAPLGYVVASIQSYNYARKL